RARPGDPGFGMLQNHQCLIELAPIVVNASQQAKAGEPPARLIDVGRAEREGDQPADLIPTLALECLLSALEQTGGIAFSVNWLRHGLDHAERGENPERRLRFVRRKLGSAFE